MSRNPLAVAPRLDCPTEPPRYQGISAGSGEDSGCYSPSDEIRPLAPRYGGLSWAQAFRSLTPRHVIAEGDTVVAQWKGQVTHEGVFHGLPPTGKRISVSGINVYVIADGKIAREWEQMDSLGMLQQLGAL